MQHPRPVEPQGLMFGGLSMVYGDFCPLSAVLRFPRRWCVREQELLFS